MEGDRAGAGPSSSLRTGLGAENKRTSFKHLMLHIPSIRRAVRFFTLDEGTGRGAGWHSHFWFKASEN